MSPWNLSLFCIPFAKAKNSSVISSTFDADDDEEGCEEQFDTSDKSERTSDGKMNNNMDHMALRMCTKSKLIGQAFTESLCHPILYGQIEQENGGTRTVMFSIIAG